ADRAKLIKDTYQGTGASIRDLSRGLGMGRSIIGRAVKMWQTKRPPVLSLLGSNSPQLAAIR
ncbi:MAG: hypothetical protein J7L08_04515, partial [Candidatus Aenigmarchaeota archaeon]|nr:hypothetical protein [Candidatus Aenigmarchaeota archaeon]